MSQDRRDRIATQFLSQLWAKLRPAKEPGVVISIDPDARAETSSGPGNEVVVRNQAVGLQFSYRP
jgi:hypothetical protein